MRRFIALFGLASLSVSSAARADDGTTAAPPPDKSAFTLLNPTPEADLRSLCTDRPTKSTGPCTVDAGRWQIESDIYNIAVQTTDGVYTRTQLFTDPTLKLGVTNTLDLEVSAAPYEQVTTHNNVDGLRTTFGGFGDLYLRAKWNLFGDDGGNVSAAFFPFVKVPTAPLTIGDGAVEEGLIVPVQINLPGNLQLAIDPEADALANTLGAGRHLNIGAPVSLGYPVTKTITVFGELWGDINFVPRGSVTQVSFDLAAAWIPPNSPNLQFDGGVNLGLNRLTPGAQAYIGVSRRF